MCNCSSLPANICNQCTQGQPCCCPPDYSVIPALVPCKCCASGYSYVGITPNFPNGSCVDNETGKIYIAATQCPSCEEIVSADCVKLPAIPCLGLAAGTTVTQLAEFLCSPSFIEVILTKIGSSSILGSGFCQLVQNCPPSGTSTTPIIGTIIVTFP